MQFELLKTDGAARRGTLTLAHGQVQTPVFMPVGSPGMDGPAYGGRRDPYNVLLIARNGGAAIFKRYS